MPQIKNVGVFCGSKPGLNDQYADAAKALGKKMADRGMGLVFGGGKIGLMGEVADQVLANGGKVTGIIPQFLNDLEVAHEGVTDLIIVDTMHERKSIMYSKSDAFLILPGGLGTLDECMEIITWKQLRLHELPIVILDICGYWGALRVLFEDIVKGGFAHHKCLDLFTIVESVDEIFEAFNTNTVVDPLILKSHL